MSCVPNRKSSTILPNRENNVDYVNPKADIASTPLDSNNESFYPNAHPRGAPSTAFQTLPLHANVVKTNAKSAHAFPPLQKSLGKSPLNNPS